MIGTKFNKTDIVGANSKADSLKLYSAEAAWCNENNCHVEEQDGYFVTVENDPVPEPTTEEKIAALESAVQSYMDEKVKVERGYDSVYTAITYINSPTTRFATEARAVLEWRDAIWNLCNTLLAQYKDGVIEELTAEEVIAKLPALEWNTEAI